MPSRKVESNDGYILVAVLVLLAVVSATALSAANMALLDTQLANHWQQRQQAKVAADFGLQQAQQILLTEFAGESSLAWFDEASGKKRVGFHSRRAAASSTSLFDLTDSRQWQQFSDQTVAVTDAGLTFSRYVVEYLGKIEQSAEVANSGPSFAFRISAIGSLDAKLAADSVTEIQQRYLLLAAKAGMNHQVGSFYIAGSTWRDIVLLE